jgi:hypothetical protein
MKRLIQLPYIAELNPLPVMKQVFTELTEAFRDYNCEIKIVNSINQLEDGGIIFLDDAGGRYINNKDIYVEIGKKCPTSVFICWYWRDLSFQPFNYILYTGEHHINLTKDSQNYDYMTNPKFVPLKLRANESPNLIGKYDRNYKRDYCFMGGGYRRDWVPSEFTGLYHQVIYDNYLSYNERREIYLSSMFAFAFQSDENIKTGHLSQRIFEGLAYGCITLCENKLAEEITDGAVIYISSKDDLISKMHYYKNNRNLILEIQKRGYEWIKKYGTNRVSIQLFLDKIKEVYNLEFTESKAKNNIDIKMSNTFLEDVKGEIEDKRVNGSNFSVKGWAFNEKTGVCPIRCKYEGTTKNVTIQSRPDIVDKFNRKSILLCGWTVDVPQNKFCDVQIKVGSDWLTFANFNSTVKIDDVKPVETKSLQNEVVVPNQEQSLDKYINNALADFFKKYPDANPTNTKILRIRFDLTKNRLPNMLIIDNFYNNIDEIRKFTLDNTGNTNILSGFVKSIATFKDTFEQILNAKISNFNKYETNGAVSLGLSGESIVIGTGESEYGAVLFLTPNAPVNTGITLYRSKHTGKMTVSNDERDQVFQNGDKDTTEFEPVDVIGNIYNRLVIFNTKFIHGVSHNFGNKPDNGRLVQTFAFDLDNSETTKISFNM